MTYEVDYPMLGVMIISGIIMIVFFYTAAAILTIEIPSEEKCQNITGYEMQENVYAEKYFCEFNETGWHLNKTKFREALSKMEDWIT